MEEEDYRKLILEYHQLQQRIESARYYGEYSGLPSGQGLTSNIKPCVADLRLKIQSTRDTAEAERLLGLVNGIVVERKRLQEELKTLMNLQITNILASAYVTKHEMDKKQLEYKLKNYLV